MLGERSAWGYRKPQEAHARGAGDSTAVGPEGYQSESHDGRESDGKGLFRGKDLG